MKRWEYFLMHQRTRSQAEIKFDLVDRLNQAGQNGWEAVAMIQDDWSIDVLIKRPIGEDFE